MEKQDGSKDTWAFGLDTKNEWRWTRTAPNGEIVGVSHEGYKNKLDCQANAERNGWPGDGDYLLRREIDKKRR